MTDEVKDEEPKAVDEQKAVEEPKKEESNAKPKDKLLSYKESAVTAWGGLAFVKFRKWLHEVEEKDGETVLSVYEREQYQIDIDVAGNKQSLYLSKKEYEDFCQAAHALKVNFI